MVLDAPVAWAFDGWVCWVVKAQLGGFLLRMYVSRIVLQGKFQGREFKVNG